MCSNRHILSHSHSALPTHDNVKLLVRDQMIFAFHVGFQIIAPTYGAGLVRHFIHACKNTGLAGKIVNPGKNLIAKSGFLTLKMIFYKKSRKYAHSYSSYLHTFPNLITNQPLSATQAQRSKLKGQSSKVKGQSSKLKAFYPIQSRLQMPQPANLPRPPSPGFFTNTYSLVVSSNLASHRKRFSRSHTQIHRQTHTHPYSPRSSEKIIHSSKIPSIG